MAALKKMPKVEVGPEQLSKWGKAWLGTDGTEKEAKPPTKPRGKKAIAAAEAAATAALAAPKLQDGDQQEGSKVPAKKAKRFDRAQSMTFGLVFDRAFGKAVAAMLGNAVVEVSGDNLQAPTADCMEVGKTRIVGGIRPQNYDAAYRPDGPRIVFDSKTLNERKSVGKNWQNMINDLSTEATTVHTRFPMCIVAFIVAVPRPALDPAQERDIIRTLTRLGTRRGELDQHHLAEAIGFVVWNPEDGTVDPNVPPVASGLRLEHMHTLIEKAYLARYANLPPHQETAVEDTPETYDDEDGGETGAP